MKPCRRRSFHPASWAATALLAGSACKSTEPAPQGQVQQTVAAAQPAAQAPTAPAAAHWTGQVQALSTDATLLQRPTTAAVRGQELWVSIGQLSALFTDGARPELPFRAISLPLAGGAAAATSIQLPGDDYYPEGIAAAPDGTLYIGSIMQGTILKVAPGSTKASPFVPKSTARRGVIGVTVDAPRGLLWFCDSNPKLPEAEKAGELVGVQLADGKEVVRHALPKAGDTAPFCNDVIASPDGDLWITESLGGRVFRVRSADVRTPGSAEAWVTGGEVAPPPGGFGPNGIEWVEGQLVVANVGRGTLVRLDPKSQDPSRGAEVIALSDASGQPVTLCSPDGLEPVPGARAELIVVENGGCPAKAPRIAKVTLKLD